MSSPRAAASEAPRHVPEELALHEPVRRRRSVALWVGYAAVTVSIATAFLLQILQGVCPVP